MKNKLPKTYKGKMQSLRKLLENNKGYPPSQILWHQMLEIVEEQTPIEELSMIQERIRREADRYKPGLPEPLLARVYFQGHYYYLDARNNLYRHDPGNALVGNLIGHLEEEVQTEKITKTNVIIDGKKVLEIPIKEVEEKPMYNRTYYLDQNRKVYRGLHPQRRYVYLVGKLNNENKIEL